MRDTDRGFARLLRQMQGGFAQRIAVGVLSRQASRRIPGSDISLLAVAMIHEFGDGRIPERSFIRAWADENEAKNLERIRRVARAVIQRTGNEERLLREIAREMVEEIRARIVAGIDPPRAASTVRRWGEGAPLGERIARAVTSEVRSPNRRAA